MQPAAKCQHITDSIFLFVPQEFNQSGGLTKCKPRRLLLLNDLVVCVSVGAGSDDAERLGLKWAHPVQDVEVLDTGTSPTLSRVLAQGIYALISLLLLLNS